MDNKHSRETSPAPGSFRPERHNRRNHDIIGMRGGDSSFALHVDTELTENPQEQDTILQPPTPEEARLFYYGLSSRPRLIGRLSSLSHPWETILEQEARHHRENARGRRQGTIHFEPRTLTPGPIGRHAILRLWTGRLISDFVSRLQPLPWRTIDVLRFIETDCDQKTVTFFSGMVVVWVSLAHNDTPWNVVVKVLHDCRQLLDSEGLHDVDVQLRMAQPAPLNSDNDDLSTATTSSSSPAATSTPIVFPVEHSLVDRVRNAESHFPFTSAIGQMISPTRHPMIAGSLGIFCWVNRGRGAAASMETTYAITCRHVGMAKEHNELIDHVDKAHMGGTRSGRPSQTVHGIAIATQQSADECIDRIVERRDKTASLLVECTDDRRKEIFKGELEILDNATKAFLVFKNAEARKIGHVVYSPPISMISEHRGNAVSPWLRDICLIKLDKQKGPSSHESRVSIETPWPANFVDLRMSPKDSPARLSEFLNSFPQVPPPARPGHPRPNPVVFTYPKTGLLKISGTIPLEEMNSPPGPTQNRLEDYCIVVGKNGAITGLTWGWASELLSVRRCPFGEAHYSREWAIYGLGKNGPMDKKSLPFSDYGDSGSAVFGIDGRLGGFLTSGLDPNLGYGADVTYATPAGYVLDDIEKALGTSISF